MADTFFEKWLEEQRKELPGDKSEKYKKIKAALDAKEQPAIEKRKQQAKNCSFQSPVLKNVQFWHRN